MTEIAADVGVRAIGLYTVLARDFCDFVEMLEDASDEVLSVLYLMLTLPSRDREAAEKYQELNTLGSGPVKRALEKREWDCG